MEWIDAKTVFIIIHLFGVALGAGGAFTSDALFLFSTKDRLLDTSELALIKRGSLIVWIGVVLLLISGTLLFMLDPSGYLASSKFITKMIIVGVIIVNGIVFHTAHIQTLEKIVGKNISTSPLFIRRSIFLYASGAISVVSWIFTIVLGALRAIPLSVQTALLVYIGCVLIAICVSQIQRIRYLKTSKPLKK